MSESSRSTAVTAWIGLVVLAPLWSTAWAQYVPVADPAYHVEGGSVISDFGNASATTTGVQPGFGTAASSAAVSPGLSASVSGQSTIPTLNAGNSYDAQAEANAQLYYYLAAVGPSANVSVPLTISALVGATADSVTGGTASADAYVQWSLNGVMQGKVNIGTGCTGTSCTANDFALGVPAGDERDTAQGLLITNVPFTTNSVATTATTVSDGSVVVIYAGGLAYTGTGLFSASADPVIEIDPTWLASHPGYHLVFSSNVTPPSGTGTGPGTGTGTGPGTGTGTGPGSGTTSVPEPDTLLLSLLGFAGIALWPRRTKALAPVSPA
jgi:hypothetical protein